MKKIWISLLLCLPCMAGETDFTGKFEYARKASRGWGGAAGQDPFYWIRVEVLDVRKGDLKAGRQIFCFQDIPQKIKASLKADSLKRGEIYRFQCDGKEMAFGAEQVGRATISAVSEEERKKSEEVLADLRGTQTSLRIENDTLTLEKVAELAAMKKLELLTLRNVVLTAEVIQKVGALPALKKLHIMHDEGQSSGGGLMILDQPLYNDILAGLKGTGLEELSLRYVKCDETGLQHLRSMPNLKSVILNRVKTPDFEHNKDSVTAEMIAEITRIPKLEKLVCHPYLSKESLAEIVSLTELRHLTIVVRSGLLQTAAQIVGTFEKLESLSLTSTDPMKGDAIRHLSGLQNLTTLQLHSQHQNELGAEGLKVISGFKKLKTLHLPYFKVSDNHLMLLKGLPLESLHLQSNSRVTDKFVAFAAKEYPNLREISLRYCSKITNKSIGEFKKMKNLKRLNMFSTKISARAIKEACPELELYSRDYEF